MPSAEIVRAVSDWLGPCDRESDTAEQESLLARVVAGEGEALGRCLFVWRYLCSAYVLRYGGMRNYAEAKDALQECFIALRQAIRDYRPERGRLTTIAYWYMRTALRRDLRDKQKHAGGRTFFFDHLSEEEGTAERKELELTGALRAGLDLDFELEAGRLLATARSVRNGSFLLRWLAGWTDEEQAQEINAKRQAVQQRRQVALDELRESIRPRRRIIVR